MASKMLYREDLMLLISNEFPGRKVESMDIVGHALTSIVYKVKFEDKTYYVKITDDANDIDQGKGEREMNALMLANKLLGPKKSPTLGYFFENYNGFPDHVLFIEELPGKTLSAEDFNKIGGTDENVSILVDMIKKLHSHRENAFSNLTEKIEFSLIGFLEYDYHRFKRSLEEAGLLEDLEKEIKKMHLVFDYFKDFKDFRFIHGDINYKNILMVDNKVSSLVDWGRARIAPITFEFGQVGVLTEKYGVTNWHEKLVNNYLSVCDYDETKFWEEYKYTKYYMYFKLLHRKLTHQRQKNMIEITVETGEELTEHFIRKIKEFSL